MRRSLLLVCALILGLAVVSPALADPPPWSHNHRPTTTTANDETTTTIEPTTTVAFPTTTTTTIPPGCGGPVIITGGGTYSGCYRSTDPAVPAVRVTTTAPVILDHARIEHLGIGVDIRVRGDLTVRDSTIGALDPGQPISWQASSLYAYAPAALVVEHNQVTDGHGVVVNGSNLLTSPFRVEANNFTNVGRYDSTGWYPGPVHTDKVLAPGGSISWNRSTATYGSSLIEDAFGIYQTNGAPGAPLLIAHNLVDGAYPLSGDGANFTGGAFDLGDSGGSWLTGDANYAVNYTNNAFMIPSGDHITYQNSRAAYDGWAGSGTTQRVSSSFGDGVTTWNNPSYPPETNCAVTDVDVSHLRWNGSAFERADYYLPTACTYSGNDSLAAPTAALEASLVAEYEAGVVAAGVTIGPRD